MSPRATCPRCGSPLIPLAALAAEATRADVALKNMRLAVPDVARRGLHSVASALRCHASLCAGEIGGQP